MSHKSFLCAAGLLCAAVCALAQAPAGGVAPGGPNANLAGRSASVAQAPVPKGFRSLILPNGEATLGSQRLGRVLQVSANIGASFAQNQILVELDCSDPKAQIEVLKVEQAAAVETYEAKLVLKGLDQASDVEVALAASAVQKIKAQINQLMVQVDNCTVKAPWAGRVIKVHTRAFSTVGSGDPLVDVIRAGPQKVRMNLPSSMAGSVKSGSRFVVRVDETGKEYPGRLVYLNARVDPVSQILEVEGLLDRDYAGLLPGMSGEAQFVEPTEVRR
jgi:membrane fusion protein, multidrug efflux system